MATARRKLAVICGHAPVPRESFIRRDLESLGDSFDIRVFGLGKNIPSISAVPLLRHYPPLTALRLALRLRTVRDIADFVGNGGLILAHFAWLTADIASAAAQLAGCPWISFVHAWDVFTRPPHEIARRLSTASKVIACSDLAAQAVRAAGLPEKHVEVIHHGIDFAKMPKRCPNGQPSVLAVGRLVPKKGFDILLRAWPSVVDAFPQATLEIIGDGPCARQLANLAQQCPHGSVRLTGERSEEETLNAIAEASLLVLPSKRLPNGDRDGIANVILEAMAIGIPVITTDAGAAGEVIRDGETGILLPSPLTPSSLADAICGLLSDTDRQYRLAANARRTVLPAFDSRVTSAQLKESLFLVNRRLRADQPY